MSAAPPGLDSQRGTRNKVARSILDHGPSTAAALAERLDLTPAAVRRHLDALLAEGLVEAREQRPRGERRGRGRPAKVFALTDCGRDTFYQEYDRLAVEALDWIARLAGGGSAGADAVAVFARARLADAAARYARRVDDAGPGGRVQALAEALSADGYAATARTAPAPTGRSAAGPARPGGPRVTGEQLCQHHCPVAHVAERFPQLCEAETELFSHLLGTHVQRLATIAHGDGVCTTYVPPAVRSGAPPPARPPAPRGDGAPGPHRDHQQDHDATDH
ncbi:putative ArsR family transcriptional regulator [Allostreptomyces psammosilenae]|uniref:Putative ArsR family transcriptional regulator n=1 Tax=Allostreptomyces psammosilenae TaxID=1892865 RepID=A0A853A1D5_9ACTN|nr:helix-turn-helix domain-containing protein [Allostreptomyces psammosilenae]NYI07260.1 putative ArsR family transcriptional regulator [Allostreptomyces psammosilenae]